MFDPGLARRLAGTLFLRADTQRDERAEERARPVEDFLRNLRGWLPAARATRRQVARLVRLVDAAAAPLATLDDAAVAARFHSAVALLRIGRGDRADLAALPTVAVGYMKRNLNAGLRGSLSDVLDAEAVHMVRTFETDDHKGAAAAFVEKRPPTFNGR
mgnify:CR=1 FL=1